MIMGLNLPQYVTGEVNLGITPPEKTKIMAGR